jgi:hypothetical protein
VGRVLRPPPLPSVTVRRMSREVSFILSSMPLILSTGGTNCRCAQQHNKHAQSVTPTAAPQHHGLGFHLEGGESLERAEDQALPKLVKGKAADGVQLGHLERIQERVAQIEP